MEKAKRITNRKRKAVSGLGDVRAWERPLVAFATRDDGSVISYEHQPVFVIASSFVISTNIQHPTSNIECEHRESRIQHRESWSDPGNTIRIINRNRK